MVAPLGNATVNVLARTVLFEQSLKRSLKRMSLLTAGIFAGVGAANFLSGAVKNSLELEKTVARIQGILGGSGQEAFFSAFSADKIRDFSNELGVAANDVGQALQYMVASGVDAKDAFAAVKAASDIAIGQGANIAQTADFVSTALNAYGGKLDTLTGKQVTASGAADILVQALNDGKGSMNDFSKYVSTAIPIASQLGISLSEVSSFAAANTLTGTSARKVFTGMAYAMRGLNNGTKGVGKAFETITGKTFKEFIAEGGNVKDALKILGKAVGTSAITNIGGAETGLNAIQSTFALWDKYAKIRERAADSDGIAAESADRVNATFARQSEILKNQFVNFQGSVGDWLGPILGKGLAVIQEKGPQIKAALQGFGEDVKAVFNSVYPIVKPAIDRIVAAWQSVDWAGVAAGLAAFFAGVMAVVGPVLVLVAYAFAGIASAAAPVINILTQMKPVLVAVGVIWGAYRLLLIASSVATVMHAIVTGNLTKVQKANWVITKLATAALFVKRAALMVATIATGAYNFAVLVATGGLNRLTIAMTLAAVKARLMGLATTFALGPIGLIIIAIAALAAGLVYAWKKSDTFKEVVVATFNKVKDVVLTAVGFMAKAFFMYVRGIVVGFKEVLGALGHLPKWLGGGKFDSAVSAMQNIVDGIDRMASAVDELIAKGKEATWTLNNMGPKGPISDAEFAKQAKAFMDKGGMAGLLGYDDGSGTGGALDLAGDGTLADMQAAEDAAKEAAKKIKAALARVKADLNRIAKSTSKQSVDTLKQNFQTLYEDLKEAGKSSLIKVVKAQEKALIAYGKKRDKIIEKLGLAKTALKTLKDEAKGFTDNIKQTVNDLGSVAQASRGIAQTFTGIRNQMKYAIIATQQFNNNIKRLRELGLNETNLRQLVEAGPEAGAEAARILAASGQAGVGEINNLQKQLGQGGDALAKTGYDAFYKQGINIAAGLVAGLEKDQDKILKQMDKLGDRIAERFKKSLGIASPSKVFAEMGSMLPAGLSKGIDAGAPGVNRSVQSMVDSSITFGPGSISVNGVSDPKAAQRAGILSGKGIQSVLSQRDATRKLNGTG